MSAFAMFFFQHPNLLQYQQRMKKSERAGQSGAAVWGSGSAVGHADAHAAGDSPAAREPLRRLLPEVFERMRRTGWTARFVTEVTGVKYFTVALDGSQYFSSEKINCPFCLRRKDVNGETHYSHVVVGATLVRAGSHEILPLDAEEVPTATGRRSRIVKPMRASG